MMPYYIFLDDERKPSHVTWERIPLVFWTIIRNYNDFVSIITERGLPLFITFDHDLGQEHYEDYQRNVDKFMQGKKAYIDYDSFQTKTGFHCAKWLIEYCLDHKLALPEFTVHSMNSIGKENIIKLLNGFKAFQALDSLKDIK